MDSGKIRVLITKVGLDSHDRGAKVITASLREAGMEVIYLGRHQTPERIVKAAIHEDVDVIGVSCLCGEHLPLVPKVIELLRENSARDIPVIVGGVIPREDIPTLKNAGVSEVFPPGTPMSKLVECIETLVQE